MQRGRLQPDPKDPPIAGFYTIPFGGTVTNTPQRLFLIHSKGQWVAVYALFDHDYREAEQDLLAWLSSLKRRQGAKTASLPPGYRVEARPVSGDRLHVLVYHGDKPVGALAVYMGKDDRPMPRDPNLSAPFNPDPQRRMIYVDRIEVYPEHRRKGLATAMWEAVHDHWPNIPVMHSWGPAQSGDARRLNETLRAKHGPYMHLGKVAAGNTIYRGMRVPFTDEIRHLMRNYEDRDELAERRSAKVAKIILDYMSRHVGRHSTGLGIHWSTRPEMAGVAAETTGEFRDWRTIIEATYDPGDVVPEGDELYDLSAVWVGNKIEAEVLIRPGARLRITGLWVGDNVGTNVLSADRLPKMNVRGGEYRNILPSPEIRVASVGPLALDLAPSR